MTGSGKNDQVVSLHHIAPMTADELARLYVSMAPHHRITRYFEGWRGAKARAGLEGTITPYSIRHSVARYLRQQGVNAWEISAQLGHSAGPRLSITERYAAHSPDYLANACDKLNNLMALVLRGAAEKLTSDYREAA